jgi:zinc and cadmium transporter
VFVLWLYCLLAFAAALAGGALPSLFKLTHPRLQMAISFVAGLMLGLAVLGLWPHGVHILGSAERGAVWLLVGFLALFFLQRFLPFHHHDVEEGSPLEPCGHAHSLAERSARTLSWLGVALGLSLHSIFDGVAMAAAVASGAGNHGGALGLGTALAVILHKPFSALAITTLMAAGGSPRAVRNWVNVAFALVTPLGALLFFLGVNMAEAQHASGLGAALAFCAGTFLSIACADLLPELQFHRHDRVVLTLALLAGLGVAVLIVVVGHTGDAAHHAPHAATRAWREGAQVDTTASPPGRLPAAQLRVPPSL